MANNTPDTGDFDWNLTTWEGSRREQLRRWSLLSLEELIRAQEDMAEIAERFARMRAAEQTEKTKPPQA